MSAARSMIKSPVAQTTNRKAGRRQSDAPSAEAESSSNRMTEEVALPLGKAFASTNKSVREGAIHSLAAYLSQTNAEPLSDVELARLWKGIFYCFWMSDKPRVQQALAQELAEMLLRIQGAKGAKGITRCQAALRFLEGFFDAMVREWWGLDKWRVDKFMMLVRRFLNGAFRLLAREGWEHETVERFTSMLIKQGGALQANDVKTPDGLMYHICDIFLEELEKVCALEQDESANKDGGIPTVSLLLPFITTAAKCHASHHFDRIVKSVIQPLLEDCLVRQREEASASLPKTKRRKQNESSTSEQTQNESSCAFPALLRCSSRRPADLRKEIFDTLFKMASEATSVEARRRRIYKMCKEEEDRLEDEEDEH